MVKVQILLVLTVVSVLTRAESEPPESSLLISTTSGLVKGLAIKMNDSLVEQYLNIPYAEPPVGKLRFAKPVPLLKSSEVKNKI